MKNKPENNIDFLAFNYFLYLLEIISLILSFKITAGNSSEIHLVVKGGQNESNFTYNFEIEPSQIIVNGIQKNSCTEFCELEYKDNNVTIIFNVSIESCFKMFNQLQNVKEIDLTNFDFSGVKSMSSMFYNCTNLEK